MPKRYEGIKHSLVEQGYSEQEAKTAAAKIYESTRKESEPHLATVAAKERKKKRKKK